MSQYFGCVKLSQLLSAPLAILQCFQISQDRTTRFKLKINNIQIWPLYNQGQVMMWWVFLVN